MLATVAAADSASTVRKKYSVYIYSEAEPYAKYAIYKEMLTLCVLRYIYINICIYIYIYIYIYCKVRNINVEVTLATLTSGSHSLILRSVDSCSILYSNCVFSPNYKCSVDNHTYIHKTHVRTTKFE